MKQLTTMRKMARGAGGVSLRISAKVLDLMAQAYAKSPNPSQDVNRVSRQL